MEHVRCRHGRHKNELRDGVGRSVAPGAHGARVHRHNRRVGDRSRYVDLDLQRHGGSTANFRFFLFFFRFSSHREIIEHRA